MLEMEAIDCSDSPSSALALWLALDISSSIIFCGPIPF